MHRCAATTRPNKKLHQDDTLLFADTAGGSLYWVRQLLSKRDFSFGISRPYLQPELIDTETLESVII
jgi:hypothetical protein